VLHTSVGSFKLAKAELLLPDGLKSTNKLSRQAAQYFVVQFSPETAGSIPEVTATIESLGGAVVAYMPVSAMVARLTAPGFEATRQHGSVLAVEPYQPAFKLEPTIGRTPLADPFKALSEVYDLDIRVFAGEDAQSVASKIAELGGSVSAVYPDTVRVELHRAKLAELAAIDAVEFINEHIPARPHGEETTTVVQTGRYNQGATPYHDAGVDGSGNGVTGTSPQVLMVLGTGIQLDAGDLSDSRTDGGAPSGTHRKVRVYQSTSAFGGTGDTLGCDAPQQGGVTHGHVVSATALGNATRIVDNAPSYGDSWYAFDQQGNRWNIDGVAPGAVLVAYDGQHSPINVSCVDPLQDTITPGDLYSGGASGSLGTSYTTYGARIVNFSWGADANIYGFLSTDIDQFLLDKDDALVFVSAGNTGADDDNNGFPDEGTLGTPATTKNGLAIGSSRNATDPGAGPESRAFFSSMGPAVNATVNRIAPQLMAPGQDLGTLGIGSEYACRSNDNDQLNPVLCDIAAGNPGTSFSSAAAAGAGLLVRDYFAQGFYPSATQTDGDKVPNVSGALVKAVLIASADWMTGVTLTRRYRFNNEQGYGRIQLDKVLSLESWPASPTGMIVAREFSEAGSDRRGPAGITRAN
jgi:hypothetical protein